MPAFLQHVIESTRGTLNQVDLVFILILLIFTIRGIFKGLSGEIAGLAGMAVVLAGGWKLYEPLSAVILRHTRLDDPQTSQLLAYILAVVVLLIAVNLVIWLVRKVLHKVFDGPVERIGGALAGFLKTAAVLAIILIGVQLSGHAFLKKHFIDESWIGRTFGVRLPGWVDTLQEKIDPHEPNPEDVPAAEPAPPAAPAHKPAAPARKPAAR
ncbi:MAG: CvpA family protein [Kiritimatiellia bacterium]